MKLHIVLLALTACTVAAAPPADTRSAAERLGLRGEVKEIDERGTRYVERAGGWFRDAPFRTIHATFDNSGRYVMHEWFNRSDTRQGIAEHDYDQLGELTELSMKTYNARGVLSMDLASTFDGGRPLQSVNSSFDYSGKLRSKTVTRFDEHGDKVESTVNGPDGALTERWEKKSTVSGSAIEFRVYNGNTWTYGEDTVFDSDGRVVKSRKWWPRGDSYSWVYDYDEAGRLQEARFTRGTGSSARWTYRYDGAGNVVLVRHLRPNGSVQVERSYTYSSDGSLATESARHMSEDGSRVGVYEYTFDSRGRTVTEVYRHGPQQFETRWLYEYDAAGRTVEQTRFDTTGRTFEASRSSYNETGAKVFESRSVKGFESGYRISNEYDVQGRLVSVTRSDLAGRVLERSTKTYTPHGDIERDAVLNPDGSLRTLWSYVYEYDAKGNWVYRLKLFTDNANEVYDSPREELRRRLSYHSG